MARYEPSAGTQFARTSAFVDAALYHLDQIAGDVTGEVVRDLIGRLTFDAGQTVTQTRDVFAMWSQLSYLARRAYPDARTRENVLTALRTRADEMDNPPTEADVFGGLPAF